MTRSILLALFLYPFHACDLYAQSTTGETTKQAYAVLLGSGSEFRGETTLHANGQIARSIFQETAHTPKDARRDGIWKEMSYAQEESARIHRSMFFGGAMGVRKPISGDSFFQANGVFASADKLPDHVLLKAAPGMPASKLILKVTRTDLVFVSEYSWHETLTKMDKPGKEREELARIAISTIEQIISDALGKDYDPGELFTWLRKEGKQELVSLLTELDNVGPDKANDAMGAVFEARLKKWDLHPEKDLAGQLVPLVAKSIRDKTGKHVSEKTVLGWFNDPAKFESAMVQNTRIDQLKEFGAQFLYTMTLPGVILETNGYSGSLPEPTRSGGGMCCPPARPVIRGKNAVPGTTAQAVIHWSFGRHEAHTNDFTMHVRTLASDKALQEKLLKSVPLEAKESAIAYRKLVQEQEPLLKVLRECRATGSMQPLMAYREQLGEAQLAERERVDSVLKVLGLTSK